MSKIIFKKIKKIIGMHFGIKSYLKSNHNYTDKQALSSVRALLSFTDTVHN